MENTTRTIVQSRGGKEATLLATVGQWSSRQDGGKN
jgi:hypothetical protein